MSSIKRVIQFLESALKGSKPGLKAQLKMVTYPRPGHKTYREVEDSCIKAGVLVLLYPWKRQLHLVLTQRPSHIGLHQAQISFPGGRQEDKESLEQAALREAHEELRIPVESIRILGELTPLYIPPTNYCIYPVVAATGKRPDFQPSEDEVAEIIEVPLDHLLNSQCMRREVWIVRGLKVEVPFYLFREHKIWGATAMVLAELLDLVKSIDKQGTLL